MQLFLRVVAVAIALSGLTACVSNLYLHEYQNLPREGKVHEAPKHVSAELLAECTSRLKTYEKKGLFGSVRYEQIGPLQFSPGFTCHAGYLPPSGYKLKSFTAPVVEILDGVRKTTPTLTGRPFLLCEFAQVKGKVVFGRWHVGPMIMHAQFAKRCGLSSR